ncbi:MAG: hypothetical protein WEF86_08510 [Gemmatimonadota bacterium]
MRAGSEVMVLNPGAVSVLPELYGVERVIVFLGRADASLRSVVLELRDAVLAGDERCAFEVFMPIARAAESTLAWRHLSPQNASLGMITSAAHVDVHAFATSNGSGARGYALHARGPSSPGSKRPLLVYAGETRPCYSVLEASHMAQVLIHDASYGAGADRAAAAAGRSTSAQAAAVARAGGVRRLVLIPHRDLPDRAVAAIEAEAARFFRDVHVATGALAYRINEDGVGQVGE